MSADEFKQRFYPFHPKLYRIAYALLNDANDTEDMLQDLYCKLWNKRSELDVIDQPEAFCVTLIKNLCMDYLRSAKNRLNIRVSEMPEVVSDHSPAHDLESKEEMGFIEGLIDRLPAKQQTVIRMRGSGDCTLEEIESVTGESAANVRVLLSRARKGLREMLTDEQKIRI